jgi:rhodanese-related sulfurtransferase
MSITTIGPRRLAELCQGGKTDLLDVRTPVEFRQLHAADARNVPLDRLDPAAVMQARHGDGPLYVICRSGSRGRQACEKFLAAGFPNVINIEGGTLAWAECGLPVVRGKKTIFLERQVRFAAGSLVLLGVLSAGWLFLPSSPCPPLSGPVWSSPV